MLQVIWEVLTDHSSIVSINDSCQNQQFHMKILLKICNFWQYLHETTHSVLDRSGPWTGPSAFGLMWTPSPREWTFNDPTGSFNWVENVQV